MRPYLLLDVCLFALLQLATSQECKKADADISGGNLILNIKNICSCYKPEIAVPSPDEKSTLNTTCNVNAVRDVEGKLSIRLQDLCSNECKSKSERLFTIITTPAPETPSTSTIITKDSASAPVSFSSPLISSTNATTSRPVTVLSEHASNTTVSTPVSDTRALPTNTSASTTAPVPTVSSTNTSTLSPITIKSATNTTSSTPIPVGKELPVNTSASTIAPIPTVIPSNTSTLLPTSSTPVTVITNLPTNISASTISPVPTVSSTNTSTPVSGPVTTETPTKVTKSFPTTHPTHDHTSNETVKEKDPHSKEFVTADEKANGSSTGTIILFFFIGAVVGIILVLAAGYISKKYKSRTYEPREPEP